MKRMNKSGQQTMGMPFGMIFAIFLIVVFVVIAFIAVRGFLDIGETSGIGLFYDELQDAVNEAWSQQSGESDFKINLPSGIEEVCFGNLSNNPSQNPKYKNILKYDVYDANTFLLPPEKAQGMSWKLIEHINITKITELKNPYCVPVKKGLTMKKDFYDKLVSIE